MADNTPIEWTDATANAVNGCSVLSPGCTNCYAMRLAGTRMKHHPSRAGLTIDTKAGPVWNGEVRLSESALLQPLRWRRPRRIFWNAHGDLFHDAVPDEWIDRCFAVMALTPQHSHQVLTKRSARMLDYMTGLGQFSNGERLRKAWRLSAIRDAIHDLGRKHEPEPFQFEWPLRGVWLGVSVEDQTRADERREDFRATPAAVKFVSYEPALGPVDWSGWEFVNQIIGGGESGPRARPMHPDWQRATRDFCADHSIAYFLKQNGEFAPGEIACDSLPPSRRAKGMSYFDGKWDEAWSEVDGHCDDEPDVYRIGKKRAGRLLDGVLHDEMPA